MKTYSYDELWGMMERINKECDVFQDKILITNEEQFLIKDKESPGKYFYEKAPVENIT